MRHYELVVVLSPMLNQEQASTEWVRIKEFITNRDSEIDHEETWGTRRLAYAIKKGPYHFLEGSYHLTRFSTETHFNQELLTFLRLDEQVLRSLLTVTGPPQPIPEPPPVVVQAAVTEQPEAAEATAAGDGASEPSAPAAVAEQLVEASMTTVVEEAAPEASAPAAVAVAEAPTTTTEAAEGAEAGGEEPAGGEQAPA